MAGFGSGFADELSTEPRLSPAALPGIIAASFADAQRTGIRIATERAQAFQPGQAALSAPLLAETIRRLTTSPDPNRLIRRAANMGGVFDSLVMQSGSPVANQLAALGKSAMGRPIMSLLPTLFNPTGNNPAPLGSGNAGVTVGGGGFLEGLTNIIQAGATLAKPLADAGVIRGTVGRLLSPQMASPAPMPMGAATTAAPMGVPTMMSPIASSFAAGPALGGLARILGGGAVFEAGAQAAGAGIDALFGEGNGGMNTNEQLLMQALMGGGLGGGGGMANIATCPGLFRQPGLSKPFIPSRIQVQGPDGSVFVLANLGKATRGSREESVMKRLAKQNGFVTRRKGSGGR